MIYRRCVWTLLAAAGVFALLASRAAADGPGYPYWVPSYYGQYPVPSWVPSPAYGWYYYNPYVAPYPAYGILPPPLATLQIVQRNMDRQAGLRRAAPPRESADELVADVSRFRFEVTVPTPDAIVLVNGSKTTQTGLQRSYVTPPLVVDKYYTYSVEVQWTDETGSKHVQKTSFDFLLGEPTKHLRFPLQMTK